ncbi:MAG: phosphonate ABC transporter ATP-binding protein [Pseudomonadota bacterium]
MTASTAIDVRGLQKSFGRKNAPALKGVSCRVREGEMVALIGASGSGKSTLLRHLSGLVLADRNGGSVEVLGQAVQADGRMSGAVRIVRKDVGVVFQQFNLVNRLSVLTNVLIGLLGRMSYWRGCLWLFSKEEKQKAMGALARVGIAETAGQRASTLSGGQQQRAAIARALVQDAKVILADEPIASLDPASSRRVMEILKRINREDSITIVVSLHQVEYARQFCPRTIALRDGAIVYDGPSAALTPALLGDLYGAGVNDALEPANEENKQVEVRDPDPRADLAPVSSVG